MVVLEREEEPPPDADDVTGVGVDSDRNKGVKVFVVLMLL